VLLVLDEPTIGLDVVSKATVRGFLARLNAEQGTTILLTTHDLGDIERLCRRVMAHRPRTTRLRRMAAAAAGHRQRPVAGRQEVNDITLREPGIEDGLIQVGDTLSEASKDRMHVSSFNSYDK
jgi:ABC-type multidrug transport system ATPase subunit